MADVNVNKSKFEIDCKLERLLSVHGQAEVQLIMRIDSTKCWLPNLLSSLSKGRSVVEERSWTRYTHTFGPQNRHGSYKLHEHNYLFRNSLQGSHLIVNPE